jgi:hypothetical protein
MSQRILQRNSGVKYEGGIKDQGKKEDAPNGF